ncbi:hypothetical protein COLO4_14883 [Corchorus olitorius]|uniref:F-box domain-containing protein n=1 Tax=Corchorus olitorius TaxID=93759 RepID=A0A1R3JQU6_9ROSI|nr:hypothetical protein COLO4_14883 [Corchorus olitorius]
MSDYFNLPEELFLEILVRLPVEALVKFTAVCKSWNSLIKNPIFISTHRGKTISSSNSRRLFLFRLCTSRCSSEPVVEHYSLRLDNEDVDEYKQLQIPSNQFRSVGRCFRVVGTCNGPLYGAQYYYGNSFVNGAIHLLAYDREGSRCRALAFDVSEQVFSEIPLPDHLSNASFFRAWLLKYRQSSIAIMTWKSELT